MHCLVPLRQQPGWNNLPEFTGEKPIESNPIGKQSLLNCPSNQQELAKSGLGPSGPTVEIVMKLSSCKAISIVANLETEINVFYPEFSSSFSSRQSIPYLSWAWSAISSSVAAMPSSKSTSLTAGT